jgi:hypothetical protein
MRKERKHFTPEEKVAILRRHLVNINRPIFVTRGEDLKLRQLVKRA